MRHTLAITWTVITAFAVFVPAASAQASTPAPTAEPPTRPSEEELLEEMRELRGRMTDMEAELRTLREATPRHEDARATADAVQRDADRRSSLIPADEAAGVGYDDGFYLRWGDAFALRPSVFTQFRYVTNWRQDADDEGDDEVDNSFELRRARFNVEGTAFSPRLSYEFTLSANRNGGDVSLLDAAVTFEFRNDWEVQAGQFKAPFNHEELTSARRQLAVERSLVNEVLAAGRVQGVALGYGGKRLRARAMFHDGADSINTDFRDTPTNPANFGVAGRAEYKLLGKWGDYKDFTASGTDTDLLVIGAGGDWTQGERDEFRGTVDLQWETAGGLGVYGALLGNYSPTDGEDAPSNFDWGAVAQAGYLFTPRWELFGRLGWLRTQAAPGDPFPELTAGVNYYFTTGSDLHHLKYTMDLTYLPDGSPSDETDAGILQGDEDQFLLRAQFQLIL